MSSNMGTVFLFFNLYISWLLICSSMCLGQDTLSAGQKVIGNETNLVSAGKIFELGFFTPITGGSQSYLGIWYHIEEQPPNKTVVWVANRDNPLGSIGVFQIAENGNLVVVDTSGNNKSYWSSNSKVKLSSKSSTKIRTVQLMDSGNLVLYDDENTKVKLWESFENPTDTFLPGMKMDGHLKLTSWRKDDDPGSGNFSFKMEQTGVNRFIISNRDQLHWESQECETTNSQLNKDQSDDMSLEVCNLLTNFSLLNDSKRIYDNTRLFLDSTGMIQWAPVNLPEVESIWKQPKTNCSRYSYCGNFSSCNDNNNDQKVCKCLPGFDNDNSVGKNSPQQDMAGCKRRQLPSCTENDTALLNLTMIKTRRPDDVETVDKEEECKFKCFNTCPPCQAYSYAPLHRTDLSPSTCWIWTHNLTTLKEEYSNWEDGRRLFVVVAKPDIAPTPRTCEPCGTNTVPYPLSTGSNCGDPTYYSFRCNTMGQLFFTSHANNVNYRVIRVDPDYRQFFIYNEDNSFSQYCGEQLNRARNLTVSSPFHLTIENQCSEQVVVSWDPPSQEPSCHNFTDCHGWKHSTCSNGNGKCLCDANYTWSGKSLSCVQKETPSPTATKTSAEGNSKSPSYLILGLVLTGVVTLTCIIVFAYACRRRIARMVKKDNESVQRNTRGRFYDSERHVKDLIDMEELEENDNEGIEVPFFDFESILIATDEFSDVNKLGKGGFGSVYKGKLGDQEIAVKRLSSVSSQGLQEFKNEVVLIAKLQHRNLVKLRGYCVKGVEKILIYEYLPNKSLDLLIFDPTKSIILDWHMRFDIILGIARGLLYLHQDSRLRVIHRDLKTSNILLDEEMQPKISDFGLARIFGGKETEANTQRVVGTYGYMSPEYALDGQFSTKSDVFSFGVVLLEIISGKKNTGFYRIKEISSLLGYAWTLWREEKLQDLMDSSLCDTYDAYQFIRCSQIGLLCVQDEPDDRPHMSNVVTMLDNETTILSVPKQPTFFTRQNLSNTASSSVQLESIIQEGR